MRTLFAIALFISLSLAGCTAEPGQPDLGEPAPGNPAPGEGAPPTANRPPVFPPTNETPEPIVNETNEQKNENKTGKGPAIFSSNITVVQINGTEPSVVTFVFDVISEHAEDKKQIHFTYAIDMTGKRIEQTGDSKDFVKKDEHNRLVYDSEGNAIHEPLVIERTYWVPGTYNVTLSAARWRADEFQTTEVSTTIIIEPGPTFDDLCPTSPATYAQNQYFDSSDNTLWRERNGVPGLQRDVETCPSPDEYVF